MRTVRIMPHHRWLLVAAGIALSALFAWAQTYQLNGLRIYPGHTTATSGVYSARTSIVQANTAPMVGGGFTANVSLQSVVAAVQTPGAPFLSVQRRDSGVLISWPAPAESWVLQWTPTLDPRFGQWTSIAPPYATNAADYFLHVPMPVGNRFYRLAKP